jgi:hypothetical protein
MKIAPAFHIAQETSMDEGTRKWLSDLAVQLLRATANGDEPWSFLFRTEGAENFLYCPWSWTAEDEFDGEVDQFNLPWSTERKNSLSAGGAEPTELELRQWREAKCRWAACGTDWCLPAWVVPVSLRATIGGYALFLCETEGEPRLEGVYDSRVEAKAALTKVGAIEVRP